MCGCWWLTHAYHLACKQHQQERHWLVRRWLIVSDCWCALREEQDQFQCHQFDERQSDAHKPAELDVEVALAD